MLRLESFGDPALREENLLARLTWLRDVVEPRLERFLGYYRNPTTELAAALPCGPGTRFVMRPFRQFQELGMPARITGFRRGADGSGAVVGTIDDRRKEVVIENDIAWRLDTLVDFAAARLPGITSTAENPALRRRLGHVIAGILESVDGGLGNGAVRLMQELVLQGAISGSAWIRLQPTPALLQRLGAPSRHDAADEADVDVAKWLRLEVLDARHVLALPEYAVVMREVPTDETARPAGAGGWVRQLRTWFGKPAPADTQEYSFDIFGANWWQRYDRGMLAEEAANPLGVVPLVRYENARDPAAGTRIGAAGSAAVDVGMGDVEPLIGMQDELNTRLSDRAFRVTMSSFRMYLGKGIDDFIQRPIGPGQMWGTDNPDAEIKAFGGDQAAPSEEAHINEVREALDKISGVSPVAAGLIRGKLGNLTSAVALRLTLVALLARTERKRAALTHAMGEVVRMALALLDRAGVVATRAEDRGIDVNWPTPLPESDMTRLTEAQAKLALGVPKEVVLRELGYGELAAGGVKEPRSHEGMKTHEVEPGDEGSMVVGGGSPELEDVS